MFATPKRDVEEVPKLDTPIGTILRLHAVQRSIEACKATPLVKVNVGNRLRLTNSI